MRSPRRILSESAALTFGAATSDRVDCGSGERLDDLGPTFTYALWCYPTGNTDDRTLIFKGPSGSFRKMLRLNGVGGNAGNLEFVARRAGLNLIYVTSDKPFATLNRWYCVAVVFDLNAAAGELAQIYVGRPDLPAVESPYGTATDQSGSLDTDAADPQVLGNSATANAAFQGRIAAAAVFNRALSLAEVRAWQFSALDEPYPEVMAGCVGLWYPGNEGPTRVVDYAGYHNDGTVTGATLSRGVVLPTRVARRVVVRVPAGGAVQLVVADLAVAAALDTIVLTQAHVLAPADLAVAATLDAPALTQANILAVAGLDVAATLEAVGLTQAHVLAVAALAVAGTLDTIALTQAGQLTVADLLVAAGLEDVTLQVGGELEPADLTVAAALDAVALTQANQLAVEDLAVAVTLEPVTVTTGTLLEVAALAVATVLDGVALTQAHQLAPADLLVAARLEAPALVQAHILTVGDLLVAVVLDGVVLVLPAGFDRALLTDFTLAAPQLAAVAVAGPQLADVTLRSPRLTSITVE